MIKYIVTKTLLFVTVAALAIGAFPATAYAAPANSDPLPAQGNDKAQRLAHRLEDVFARHQERYSRALEIQAKADEMVARVQGLIDKANATGLDASAVQAALESFKATAVEGIAPVIISASRATDIPALYPDWFMHRLTTGYVKWINRFNGQPTFVSFEKARAFVFWTKNADPFIKHLLELDRRNLHYYFTYTLNDYETERLEPNVPSLEKRIDTFKKLSDVIGKDKVIWRFDPLLLSKTITTNRMIEKIQGIGSKIHNYTEKLVISFIDIAMYKKVNQNLRAAGFKDCKEALPAV